MISQWLFDAVQTYMLLLELVLGGAMVVVAGAKLTRLADEISDVLNLGKAWIGMLLLATVTSLPELVTGVTAVTLEPPNSNMAFGNILGSNCFNVAIIVLLNAVMRKGSVLRNAQPTTTLAVSFGIIMTAMLVLLFAVADKFAGKGPSFVGSVEWIASGLIVVTYVGLMRLLYRFEKRQVVAENETGEIDRALLKPLYIRCAVVAAVIVTAGYWLARTGNVLAEHEITLPGGSTLVLGGTFVGAFFLAIATSLPEIVTGIAAVRLGKLDLALGNLFGSNMFNVFVTPFLKVASAVAGTGPLLTGPADSVSTAGFDLTRNTLTGGLAILLMGIALASITYRSQRRLYVFGFDSVLIALVYIGGMYLLLQGGM